MTNCITEFLKYCEVTVMPTWMVCCFPNNKLWIPRNLKTKKRAFRSGDKKELRSVQHQLRDKMRLRLLQNEAKLQQNNMREVWSEIKITRYGAGGGEG